VNLLQSGEKHRLLNQGDAHAQPRDQPPRS
jgi:hypothetical protein